MTLLFSPRLTNWEVSPAQSRENNKECFLFDFYDEHDVWHMLSAFGLYYTFMCFGIDPHLERRSSNRTAKGYYCFLNYVIGFYTLAVRLLG